MKISQKFKRVCPSFIGISHPKIIFHSILIVLLVILLNYSIAEIGAVLKYTGYFYLPSGAHIILNKL